MTRVYNFSPGPAALPLEVLEQAQAEFLDWHGQGMSIVEMSHRTQLFKEFTLGIERNLRELLAIPEDYSVLFLAGGARIQFSLIPLNIMGDRHVANYVETGHWSGVAMKEAQRYTKVNVAASSKENGFTRIAPTSEWQIAPDAAYLHYTSNETIDGIEFYDTPHVENSILVSDMTSNFLSYPIDVSRFGIIYAGAQKNAGISGITILIIRKDLLDKASPLTPMAFNYSQQDKEKSLLITPPVFPWYMSGLMFEWLKRQGGLRAVEAVTKRKAQKIYDIIDAYPEFYVNTVDQTCRSRTSIPFIIANRALEERFLSLAAAEDLVSLKGHAVKGGIRISLFHGVTEEAVDTLASFMRDFIKQHG